MIKTDSMIDSISTSPCTAEHLAQLLPRVREADRFSLELTSDQPLEDIFSEAFRLCEKTTSFIGEEGTVLCVLGMVKHPQHPVYGLPWLATSNEALPLEDALLPLLQAELKAMSSGYEALCCTAHEDDTKLRQWLTKCGFEARPDVIEFGPSKARYVPFWRTV